MLISSSYARSRSSPSITGCSALLSTFCGMMCSMEKVPPEKSSEFFTCQLFSCAASSQKPRSERVAVARPELPLELHVARHAVGRPFLAQEDRLVGLTDVDAVVPHHAQLSDHRQEVFQAVCHNVARRMTNSTLLNPGQGDEPVMHIKIGVLRVLAPY